MALETFQAFLTVLTTVCLKKHYKLDIWVKLRCQNCTYFDGKTSPGGRSSGNLTPAFGDIYMYSVSSYTCFFFHLIICMNSFFLLCSKLFSCEFNIAVLDCIDYMLSSASCDLRFLIKLRCWMEHFQCFIGYSGFTRNFV